MRGNRPALTAWLRQAIIVAAMLAAAACSGDTARRMPFTPGGGETGEEIYRRACASCHGVDGRGNGPDAATIRVPQADLTMLSARAGGTFPRAYVIETITGAREVRAHGAREMPVWRVRFEPSGQGATGVASLYANQRTEALADYVETLQRR